MQSKGRREEDLEAQESVKGEIESRGASISLPWKCHCSTATSQKEQQQKRHKCVKKWFELGGKGSVLMEAAFGHRQ